MGESMWTTCSVMECGRVVLRAHVDRDGRCSLHTTSISNHNLDVAADAAAAHEPTEQEWQDLGRPAETIETVTFGTVLPPTDKHRK